MGGWPTPSGIDLRVDGLTTLMLLTINGLALIVGTLFGRLHAAIHVALPVLQPADVRGCRDQRRRADR